MVLVLVVVTASEKVAPPSVEICTTYPVNALPPSDTGAFQEMVTCESLDATVTVCGALGIPNGVADTDALARPGPAEIKAVTRNEYAVPLVKPVTV